MPGYSGNKNKRKKKYGRPAMPPKPSTRPDEVRRWHSEFPRLGPSFKPECMEDTPSNPHVSTTFKATGGSDVLPDEVVAQLAHEYGEQIRAKQKRRDAADKEWRDFTADERAAAEKIGFDEDAWQKGSETPFKKNWSDLTFDEKNAAELIGYSKRRFVESFSQQYMGTRFSVGQRVRARYGDTWYMGVIVKAEICSAPSPLDDVISVDKYEVEIEDNSDVCCGRRIFDSGKKTTTFDVTDIQPILTESQIDALWDDDNGTDDTTADEQRLSAKREKKKQQKQRRRDQATARVQAAQAAKEQRSRDGAEQRRQAELKKERKRQEAEEQEFARSVLAMSDAVIAAKTEATSPEPEPAPTPCTPSPTDDTEITPSPEPAPAKFPEDFLCPITLEPMKDPVCTVAGNTYDRVNISAWFRTHNTDPVSGTKMNSKKLVPNNLLRRLIADALDKRGGAQAE